MRIGYALPLVKGTKEPLEQAELLGAIGYDYVELPLAGFDLTGPEGTEAAKRCVASTAIPTSVLQSFMPASIRVTGPDVNEAQVKAYLGRAAEVCHAAGAQVAVFGAAWSRNVPDGWSRNVAHEQLVKAFTWTADAFKGCGAVVGIEPQNLKEANIIRFIDEAVGYAKEVNRPEIKVAIDFYHLVEEETPLTEISRFGEWICHAQTADTGRNHPGSGSYDYGSFAEQLRIVGYDEMVSVEVMKTLSPELMRISLGYLRQIWPAVVSGEAHGHWLDARIVGSTPFGGVRWVVDADRNDYFSPEIERGSVPVALEQVGKHPTKKRLFRYRAVFTSGDYPLLYGATRSQQL